MSIFLDAHQPLADLDHAMEPYDKFFKDFNGTQIFFKIVPLCKFFFVNFFFQIRAQLMTDTNYKSPGPA